MEFDKLSDEQLSMFAQVGFNLLNEKNKTALFEEEAQISEIITDQKNTYAELGMGEKTKQIVESTQNETRKQVTIEQIKKIERMMLSKLDLTLDEVRTILGLPEDELVKNAQIVDALAIKLTGLNEKVLSAAEIDDAIKQRELKYQQTIKEAEEKAAAAIQDKEKYIAEEKAKDLAKTIKFERQLALRRAQGKNKDESLFIDIDESLIELGMVDGFASLGLREEINEEGKYTLTTLDGQKVPNKAMNGHYETVDEIYDYVAEVKKLKRNSNGPTPQLAPGSGLDDTSAIVVDPKIGQMFG